MFNLLLALMVPVAPLAADEGWQLSSHIDEETGSQTLEAVTMYNDDRNDFMLLMVCESGRPTLQLNWSNFAKLRSLVFTIGTADTPLEKPVEHDYLFVRKNGYFVPKDDHARLVSTIGTAPYGTITANQIRKRTKIAILLRNTQSSWASVSASCAATIAPTSRRIGSQDDKRNRGTK